MAELRAEAPLLLRAPGSRDPRALAVVGTMGGGCLAGDDIDLEVEVGENACLALTSHGATRMHPATERRSTVALRAHLAAGARLGVLLDPVLPGHGANFCQRSEFHLRAGASLLAWEALSAGRIAHGERWAFEHAELRTSLWMDGEPLLVEATELRAEDRLPQSLQGIGGLASMWLVGPAFEPWFEHVERLCRQQPHVVSARRGPCLIVRALCTTLRSSLAPLVDLSRDLAAEVIAPHAWQAKGW